MAPQKLPICAVFAALVASTTAAQTGVTLSDRSLKSPTMDASSKQEAAAFVQAAATLLRSDDPSQVRKGREMYVKTFARPEISPAYRTAFAAIALPSLKEVVATEGALQGINAIESIKVFNSPDALTALTEQASPMKQKSPSLRLVATSGLAPAIRSTDLNTAQADSIVKAIASYIDKETDWMVLAYEIQALEVMSTSARTSREGQGTARVLEASAINALVAKIRKGTAAPEMIQVVNRSLALVLSDQLGASDATAMAAFKKSLEPTFSALEYLGKSPPAEGDPALFTQAARLADTLQKTRLDSKPGAPRDRGAGTAKAPGTR
ncbi:MAG: hypothetical protein EXS03_08365 [Phycisphaerales bacterium]|nr:hypothetical protein [Phycisphaerales bacterium]